MSRQQHFALLWRGTHRTVWHLRRVSRPTRRSASRPTAADTLSLRQRIIYVCSHAGATGISLTNLATELGMNSARIVEEVRTLVDDEKLDLDPSPKT